MQSEPSVKGIVAIAGPMEELKRHLIWCAVLGMLIFIARGIAA